jgi:hypothetical protein
MQKLLTCKRIERSGVCRFGVRSVACNGLAAVLLGVCLLHSAPSQAAGSQQEHVTTAVLLEIISSRIGLAAFFGLLDALKQEPSLVQAAAAPVGPRPVSRSGPPQDEGACSAQLPSSLSCDRSSLHIIACCPREAGIE